jgi:hypothetical protein
MAGWNLKKKKTRYRITGGGPGFAVRIKRRSEPATLFLKCLELSDCVKKAHNKKENRYFSVSIHDPPGISFVSVGRFGPARRVLP